MHFTLLNIYSNYVVYDEILALRTFKKEPFKKVPVPNHRQNPRKIPAKEYTF